MISMQWTGASEVTLARASDARDMTIPMRKMWNSANEALANNLTGMLNRFWRYS